MNYIVKSIKQELLKRCNIYKEKYGYDFWNQYKELICGFIAGFAIMYAIHKIDWEVGF